MADASTWAIIIGTLGGLSELAGLGLIVRGIQRDRVRAATIDRWPPRRQMRSRPDVLTFTDSRPAPEGWVPLGDPPDLGRIAQALLQLTHLVNDRFAQAEKSAEAKADEAHDLAAEAAWKASGEIKEHVTYVLAGSLSERRTGVVLLAAGIVAGMGANLLGNV